MKQRTISMKFNEKFVGQVYELGERYRLDISQGFAKVLKAIIERSVVIDAPECYTNAELISEIARDKRDMFFNSSKQKTAMTIDGFPVAQAAKKSLNAQLAGTVNTFAPEKRTFISAMLRNIENGTFTWKGQLQHENFEVRKIAAILIMDGARYIDQSLHDLIPTCKEILGQAELVEQKENEKLVQDKEEEIRKAREAMMNSGMIKDN